MSNQYEIETDELAVNLTRPATKFGVPFVPFFMSVMLCFFGWLLYQAISGSSDLSGIITFIMIWLFSYIFMYLQTSRDIFGLHIFWMNMTHFRKLQTFKLWNNMDSYRP